MSDTTVASPTWRDITGLTDYQRLILERLEDRLTRIGVTNVSELVLAHARMYESLQP